MKNMFINIYLLTSLPEFLIISMEGVRKRGEGTYYVSGYMCTSLCLLDWRGHTVFFSCSLPYDLEQGLTGLPTLATASVPEHLNHNIHTTALVP